MTDYATAVLRAKAGLCRECGRKLRAKRIDLFLVPGDYIVAVCGTKCLARYNDADDAGDPERSDLVSGAPATAQPQTGRRRHPLDVRWEATSGTTSEPSAERASDPNLGPSPPAPALQSAGPTPCTASPPENAPRGKSDLSRRIESLF